MSLMEDVQNQLKIRKDVEYKIRSSIDEMVMYSAAKGKNYHEFQSWELVNVFQSAGVIFSGSAGEVLKTYHDFVVFVFEYLRENGFKIQASASVTPTYTVTWQEK